MMVLLMIMLPVLLVTDWCCAVGCRTVGGDNIRVDFVRELRVPVWAWSRDSPLVVLGLQSTIVTAQIPSIQIRPINLWPSLPEDFWRTPYEVHSACFLTFTAQTAMTLAPKKVNPGSHGCGISKVLMLYIQERKWSGPCSNTCQTNVQADNVSKAHCVESTTRVDASAIIILIMSDRHWWIILWLAIIGHCHKNFLRATCVANINEVTKVT